MINFEIVRFDLNEEEVKPIFESFPNLTNGRFTCLLDSGAGIPVWCGGEKAFLDAFPKAKCKKSYKHLLSGFGIGFQVVEVYYIPKIEFFNGEHSIIFEDFYLPMSSRKRFGVDLIIPTSMFIDSKISLSQVDIQHQGKFLEIQCQTRYLKACYTRKLLFSSDVERLKKLHAALRAGFEKTAELDIRAFMVLLGGEGEFDEILVQESLGSDLEEFNSKPEKTNQILSKESKCTSSEKLSTGMKDLDAFL